jgi:hypothetical protein
MITSCGPIFSMVSTRVASLAWSPVHTATRSSSTLRPIPPLSCAYHVRAHSALYSKTLIKALGRKASQNLMERPSFVLPAWSF